MWAGPFGSCHRERSVFTILSRVTSLYRTRQEGLMRWIAAHRKLLAFAAGAAVTLAVQIWGTTNPYVALAVLAATGLGVYQVPNEAAPAPAPAPAAPGPGKAA